MKKISIKKIINTSFGFTLLFFAYSCNNEDDVCISEKSETRFDIPQGNHDFDEQIVAWSKDYDINVLYKFTLPDLNYNFTASKELNYKITQWCRSPIFKRRFYRFISGLYQKNIAPVKNSFSRNVISGRQI